ncbi:hypothetical protein HK405_010615, partial [Cladochytrium tenue]
MTTHSDVRPHRCPMAITTKPLHRSGSFKNNGPGENDIDDVDAEDVGAGGDLDHSDSDEDGDEKIDGCDDGVVGDRDSHGRPVVSGVGTASDGDNDGGSCAATDRCPAAFRRRQELLRHMRSVHGSAAAAAIAAAATTATSSSSISTHSSSSFSLAPPAAAAAAAAVAAQLLRCPGADCERRFARSDALRRHLDSLRCRRRPGGCSEGLTDAGVRAAVAAARARARAEAADAAAGAAVPALANTPTP